MGHGQLRALSHRQGFGSNNQQVVRLKPLGIGALIHLLYRSTSEDLRQGRCTSHCLRLWRLPLSLQRHERESIYLNDWWWDHHQEDGFHCTQLRLTSRDPWINWGKWNNWRKIGQATVQWSCHLESWEWARLLKGTQGWKYHLIKQRWNLQPQKRNRR